MIDEFMNKNKNKNYKKVKNSYKKTITKSKINLLLSALILRLERYVYDNLAKTDRKSVV